MEIHFELENRCLLRCRHCSSEASLDGIGHNYSVEEITDFLMEIPEEKIVFFTGGEPLLNEGFEEILLRIRREVSNICVGIFTSGIIEDRGRIGEVSESKAKRLAELGLKICYISIYSNEEKEHDWMTQMPGSFGITKKSIINLKAAGIEVRFNTVITKKNKRNIDKIVQMAYLWGVSEVRLLKLIEHGRAAYCWKEIGVSEEEYQSVVQEILVKKAPVRITASSVTNLIACRPVKNAVGCQAGSKLLYITFKGDIFPCASVKGDDKFYIGNIKEKNSLGYYILKQNLYRKNPLCHKEEK